MKYKITVVKRSGKVVENRSKPMEFFAFEIAVALDMMRKRQINKFTVEVTRGYPAKVTRMSMEDKRLLELARLFPPMGKDKKIFDNASDKEKVELIKKWREEKSV